jgi:hypothetical protein
LERVVELVAKNPKYADVNPLTRLNPGEPFFFIRAQDKLSVDAVVEYSHLLRRESNKAIVRNDYDVSDSLKKQADEVLEYAEKFVDWQRENNDLVKFPD